MLCLPAPALVSEQCRYAAQVSTILRSYHEGMDGVVRAAVAAKELKDRIYRDYGSEAAREWRDVSTRYLLWDARQAGRMIAIALAFGDHVDLAGQFALSALYELANSPEAVRTEALSRAARGEFISHQAARDLSKKKKKRGSKPVKSYPIEVDGGKVVITAPHRRRADLVPVLEAALARLRQIARVP